MTMTLHCFGESGHSYKVALTLQILGLDWRPVFVDFFNGETRSDAYRTDINEMGEVPVLTDGDTRLTQSAVIQSYLTQRAGRLGGESPEEAREILRWQLWDVHKLSSPAGMTRFLMNFLPEEKRPQEVIEFTQGRLRGAYGILDAHLRDREWIVGRDVTVADLCCCSYLFYPEPFGFDCTDWPAIDAWLGRIEGLEGWSHPYELMPRAWTE